MKANLEGPLDNTTAAVMSAVMQHVWKITPPLARLTVNVDGVHMERADAAFSAALQEFRERFPGIQPASAYDLPHLRAEVLGKIRGRDADADTIELEDHCCARPEQCPQIFIMRAFVEQLKK